jgi:hypothetical protein
MRSAMLLWLLALAVGIYFWSRGKHADAALAMLLALNVLVLAGILAMERAFDRAFPERSTLPDD